MRNLLITGQRNRYRLGALKRGEGKSLSIFNNSEAVSADDRREVEDLIKQNREIILLAKLIFVS